MSIEELKASSPWIDYLKNLREEYGDKIVRCLFYDGIDVIYPKDRGKVKEYNESLKNKDNQFITHLLAAPFQGNPLTAKVVFLTLNPGYVERINKGLAKVFENVPGLAKKINSIWSGFLSHEAESISPSTKDHGLFTAYQFLVDWYWHDMFANLRKDCGMDQPEKADEFFKKVAVIQLIPYHSTHCDKVVLNLETQKYTRRLIKEYLLKQPNCPLFVVMRSEDKWAKFLGYDKGFDNCSDKDYFVRRKPYNNGSRPRGQYINGNAFMEDGYKRIVEAITKKES